MKRVLVLLAIGAMLGFPGRASAFVYTVTGTADNTDAAPHGGTGAAGSPYQMSSLRGAILAANTNPGPDTILLPAGIYTLTIANSGGVNEDAGLRGDLDVTDSLTITGAGASNTIVQAGTTISNGIDKVFAINPLCDHAMDFTLSGVTVRFGRNTQPYGAADYSFTGGGLDWCGNGASTLTLRDCVIGPNSNINGYGGGVNLDETLPGHGLVTFSNTVFVGNTCAGSGGGLNILGDGLQVTLTGCTFSNNITSLPANGQGAQGGAVNIRISSRSPGVSPSVGFSGNSVIANNSAAGVGGGISISSPGIQNVTIQDTLIISNTASNNANAAALGGGIYSDNAPGKSTTLTNVTVSGNHANAFGSAGAVPQGGGIFLNRGTFVAGANVILSGNDTASDGGGIATAQSSAAYLMTGGYITNNRAKNNGGGLYAANGTVTLSGVTFQGNVANSDNLGGGDGGAMSVNGAILTASFCRVVSNSAANGPGLALAAGSAFVTNNWWASANPSTQISGAAVFNPWLQLRHYANPVSIVTNSTTSLLADFTTNSAGGAISATNLSTLLGQPMIFGNAVKGVLSNAQTVVQPTGTAGAIFAAGAAPGPASADATVDGVTVTAAIAIQCPTIDANVGGGGPICPGGSAVITVFVTGGTAPYSVTLNNGGGTRIGSSPLSFTNSPAATTTYSVSSAIDVNGCTATTAGTATITVNSLTNPTITPVPASLCANSAGNVASCPVGMASYAWTITNGVITSAPNLPAITYIAGASGAVGLTLVVANAFGCPATNSMSVPIPHDNTPPTIVCSSNLVITAPGRCAAPVNFTVSASDNCSLASVTATPPSGSYFPLGTNIVNVVAADVAGNTNSCSFLVTVLPGPDPVLNIVTSGTNAILSWSNSYACYSLLSSPTLDSPIASNPWTAYTGPFTTNSGFVFVTNGVDNATRYFRLVH